MLTATAWIGGAALADEAKDAAAVATQLPSAKITLQQGLTAKGATFQKVVIDYTTGKIAKSETITEADDLADAKKRDTTVKGGHAMAMVTPQKATQSKMVPESLE